jgi:hypothetical protein
MILFSCTFYSKYGLEMAASPKNLERRLSFFAAAAAADFSRGFMVFEN